MRTSASSRLARTAVVLVAIGIIGLLVGCNGGAPAGDSSPARPSAQTSATPAVEAPASAVTTAVPESASAEQSPSAPAEARRDITIAWQPSHQADTGYNGWKEYVICGDIVDRAMEELPEFEHVKAWDTKHELTGSNNYRPKPTNTKAFDQELKIANASKATVFISIHNDGGAPSGILGECMPSDRKGIALTTALVADLSKHLRMKNRGVREVRLYSLEPNRNKAEYRCLLEIGDNAADRAFLESEAGRQKIAEVLADSLREIDFEQ